MESGVYTITSPSGKRYVGSAVNFKKRWSVHLHHLRHGTHQSRQLQNAWNKHGEQSMRFEKIIICARDQVLMYEQIAIDAFAPEYNTVKLAANTTGYKHTPEAIAKMSEAHKGRVLTEERRLQLIAVLKTAKFTPESRKKTSEALRGRIRSPEHCENLRKALTGRKNPRSAKPLSEETKEKIRAKAIGRGHSEEAKAKISAAMKLRVITPEMRAKMNAGRKPQVMSEAHKEKLRQINTGKTPHNKGKPHSPETRAKLVAAHARRRAQARLENENAHEVKADDTACAQPSGRGC